MGRTIATAIRRFDIACRRCRLLFACVSIGTFLTGFLSTSSYAQGGPLALGEPVAGLVTNERGDAWTVELRQGMFVRVELMRERTSALNAEVSVVAEGGRVVGTARADALGNVRLTANCLPRNGRYSIVARSLEGRLGGRYRLRVDPILVPDELGAETVGCAPIDEATERTRAECARPNLVVEGSGAEPVRVPRGETRHIVLPSGGVVRWSCDQPTGDAAAERIACAEGSSILRVSRQAGGRAVELTCIARRFVDEAPAEATPSTRVTRLSNPRAAPPADQAAP